MKVDEIEKVGIGVSTRPFFNGRANPSCTAIQLLLLLLLLSQVVINSEANKPIPSRDREVQPGSPRGRGGAVDPYRGVVSEHPETGMEVQLRNGAHGSHASATLCLAIFL